MADPTPVHSLFDLNALLDNPVFAGGFGLASVGAALAVGRRGVIRGAGAIYRRQLFTVEISKTDPSYPWILAWLSQPRPQTGFLAKRLTRLNKGSMQTVAKQTATGVTDGAFFLQPGYKKHMIKYKHAYIQVNREKQSTAMTVTGEPHETIELTTLYAHRDIFEDVFLEARAAALKASEGKTAVYTAKGFDWAPLGQPKTKRPLSSVVFDKGIKESLVGDVREFIQSRQWYVDRGMPYRRGYMLHGPPGSGKTSFIYALAGELNYNIATVNLSEIGVTDDKLAFLLTKLPAQSIVLLEDIDSAFTNRRSRAADGYTGPTVTHSGLLNALDGVTAGEDRIVFLTTNHPEVLDPALTRPGRVDMMVRIGEATKHQAAHLWDIFYGDIDQNGVCKLRFLARLDELGLFDKDKPSTSTAAIQGLFQFNKNSMEGAIAMAEGLIPPKFEQ